MQIQWCDSIPGDNIRRLRTERRMSRRKLGRLTGTSPIVIKQLEAGERKEMSYQELSALRRVLKATTPEILEKQEA